MMTSIERFSSLSGLEPIIHKSTVFLYNCNVYLIAWFDDTYQIPNGALHVRFQGVPLISSQLSIKDYMLFVDKITARILYWINFLLSLAGRAQLISSVLFFLCNPSGLIISCFRWQSIIFYRKSSLVSYGRGLSMTKVEQRCDGLIFFSQRKEELA